MNIEQFLSAAMDQDEALVFAREVGFPVLLRPSFVLGGRGTQMIPYGLAVGLVNSGGNVDWAFVASMSTAYVILPVIFIYIFQKYLLVGMTFGTVRGEV